MKYTVKSYEGIIEVASFEAGLTLLRENTLLGIMSQLIQTVEFVSVIIPDNKVRLYNRIKRMSHVNNEELIHGCFYRFSLVMSPSDIILLQASILDAEGETFYIENED